MRTAVKITEPAKNWTFEGCTIYGWIENAWKNINFKNTIIWLEQNFKTARINHPWIVTLIGGLIVGLIIRW